VTKRPYGNLTDRRLPLQDGPVHPLGFLRTLKGKLSVLQRELASLLDRGGQRFMPTGGVPFSYVGERVFAPETQSFNLDTWQTTSAFAPYSGVQPVNYVVRDSIVHSVPIQMPGPGLFLARSMKVSFFQRWWSNQFQKEVWLPLPTGRSFNNVLQNGYGQGRSTTIKWSIMNGTSFEGYVTQIPGILLFTPANEINGLNFFWNLTDQDSQRKLSTEPISDIALLNQGFQKQADGGFFYFDTPWLFERLGQVEFSFQLINPILQLDPASASTPMVDSQNNPIDDLESGRRNQSVMVRAELHGTKFFTDRDTLLRESV
jgi:hypothetical protein